MASEMLHNTDILRLAAAVNAKRAEGFIPSGGLLRDKGEYFQLLVTGNSTQNYLIVAEPGDLQFTAMANVASGLGAYALGTPMRVDGYFIQAFGDQAQSKPAAGDFTGVLPLSKGGLGATTAEGGRATLGFDAMGLGVATQTTVASFDWQQADFVSGQSYQVTVPNWTNVPSGLNNPNGDVVNITCVGARTANNRWAVRVTSQAFTNRYEYYVVINGAKGSRTFNVSQVFTSDAVTTVPIANGGTGQSTVAYLDCSNAGTTSFPAGAYTAIPFTTQTEATGITKTSNTVFTVAAAGIYEFDIEVRWNGGSANMPPVGTIMGLVLQGTVPSSLRVGYSVAQAIDSTTVLRLTCLAKLAANTAQSVYLFNGGAAAYQVASAQIKIVRLVS